MYSDWDDAPKRLKSRKSDKPPRIAFWIMIVAILAGAIGYFVLEQAALPAPATAASGLQPVTSDLASSQLVKPPPRQMPQTSESHASIDWVTDDYDQQVRQRLREGLSEDASVGSSSKQTVFNDANYVPTQQVNVITMSKPKVAQPPEKEQRRYVHVIKDTSPNCYYPAGSIQCRRFKAEVKKFHNRFCYSSVNWNSPACRRAAAYNLAE